MTLLRNLLAPALVCAIAACSVNPGKPDDSATQLGGDGGDGSFGQNNLGGSKGNGRAGGASNGGNVKAGGAGNEAGAGPVDDDPSGDQAGAAGEPGNGVDPGSAGSGPKTDPPPIDDPSPSCELEKTCAPKCGVAEVTCGVISTGVTCEMDGFAGATLPLDACGERAVVGTACCGGCGCVPVELFFDGHSCWQGIPNCELPQFTNLMFAPHAPTEPNPSFVPASSSFTLGSAGIGGTGGVSGSGGAGGMSGSGGRGGTAGAR